MKIHRTKSGAATCPKGYVLRCVKTPSNAPRYCKYGWSSKLKRCYKKREKQARR